MTSHIPASMAPHYQAGQDARRDGSALPATRFITPEESWYRAGWHDQDMQMIQNREERPL